MKRLMAVLLMLVFLCEAVAQAPSQQKAHRNMPATTRQA